MRVEVGFVLGERAATTPKGQAISTSFRTSSLRITPTVGMSAMDSHTHRELNWFFSVLCAATP